MPLAPALAARTHERRFWTDAYWLTCADGREDQDEEPAYCAVGFKVSDGHALVLGFDSGFGYISLGLSVGGEKPVELGWDDQAHFHPHVLGWRELDAIGSAIATRDPTLAHPGIPLLMLMRFAPITDDDDGWLARHLIDQAWDRLGLFSRREREAFFDRIDARGAGFRWRRAERGDVIEQDEDGRRGLGGLYTLRAADNEAFPFEALSAMLASIPASTISAPKVALPQRASGLWITVEHSTSFPAESARFAALFLDRALRDTGLGRADVNGGLSSADGLPISSRLVVSMRGDERSARSRAAALLDACGVLPSVRWSEGPVVLPTEPRLYVQLCNLTLERWTLHGRAGVRFDRPPLDDAQRHAIAEALDRLGFARADEAGLRAHALPDGCKVEAVFPDLFTDENLDGGSLWLERLTPASVEVVCKLMTAAGLFVAAPLIAPNPKLAEAVDNPWPGTRIASDTATLLTILRGR